MGFDTRQYEWADCTIVAGGKDITGIRGFKYEENQEMEAIYAKGREPHSIQSGNVAYSGELVMLQSEYEALVKAGKGTVRSLAVNIAFSYGNPPDPITADVMLGVRFPKAEKNFKQGDKFMEITLPFIAIGLQNQK